MSEETRKRIGDYEILDELGSGGMGRVYRVRNVISDRIEAMKVLLPDLVGRQELAARFLREIKLLASLNHPNIAALRTALTLDNQLVMIMEYVEGTSLADRLERGPIPTPDALNYVDQVLGALSYAHQQHVIHRDIKPANMMLTPQGVVKLMDFGIARSGEERTLTVTGTTLGSLSYMSPEQVKGEATDARSDLYSLGISLYEMVAGQKPFQADSDYSIMAAHVKEEPKPPIELQPTLPAALNEIILMAIAKDPAGRFQSADAFRNALSNIRATSPASQAATHGTRGATLVDTAVSAALLANAPTATARKQVSSAPMATLIDAKVTPVPSVALPPRPSSHRGLYMTLGALMVLAGLVGAGIYTNSKTSAKTSAKETESPAKPGGASPKSTAPGAPSEVRPVPPAIPQGENLNSPGSKPAEHPLKLAAKIQPGGEGETNSHDEAEKLRDLDQLEHEIDQLSSRAAAINSSLDRLQQQQAAQGYGLRGDMAGRQASMKASLSKAQDAVEHGDAKRAKRYMDLAAGDVEVLEHFLGR